MQAKLDGSTEMTFENLRQRLDPPGITDASRTLHCLCVAAAACMWFREGIVQPAPINQVRVGPVPAVPHKISRLYKNESVLKLVSHTRYK